ncbi:CU044_5270 family protein [Streptomyces sp. NPDC050516]|uniref:CU044_5270 family protein n=1 Tax=Streptomyces sp. NPDC050516 TaxID=3365621 RepID=UPI00379C9088
MTRMPWGRHEPLHASEFDLLIPAPGDDPQMAADRHTALATHLESEIRRASAPAAVRRARLRRTALIGVPVAAVLAAGVIVPGSLHLGGASGQGVRAGGHQDTGPREKPQWMPLVPGTTENLSVTVDRIVLAAAAQPSLTPRQDQFIYIKSKVSFLRVGTNPATGKTDTWITPLHTRQIWKSPDGKKGFLYEPGGALSDVEPDGSDLDHGPGVSGDTRHSYNSMKALPTDPDALLKRLYQGGKRGNPDDDWMAFKEINSLLSEQIAPSATSAALYKVAARIPGVELVPKANDADGRQGIAIAFTRGSTRHEWIFDKDTYAYLGQRQVLVQEEEGLKPGTVVGQTTVIERAVTDAKRELPDGKRL